FRAFTRLALAPAALALLLAACQPSEPVAADAAPAAPAAAAPAETVGDEPALDPSAAPAGEDAAGQDQAAAVEGDSAAPPPAATSGATFATQGEHYDLIPGGQPFEPLEGKIEVVEVFNYVCPACAMFQPLVNNWK